MTNILAMDTSGPSLSVALLRDGSLLYECIQQNGLTHSESLMPLVDAALMAGRLSPAQVDCFAVTTGPGSFTGVRIGVAAVKALSRATGKPALGVNALEALAAGVALFDGAVCALRDARAGQVYCAAYRGGERILPDAAMPLTGFLAALADQDRLCFVGDGAAAYRERILQAMGARAAFASPGDMALRASAVAALAAGRRAHWGDFRSLAPFYLRQPQAERERAAREAAHG